METFPRHWPFVRGIHRSPANSPHNGQWRGALIFSLIGTWIDAWANNHGAGDLRRHGVHSGVTITYRRAKRDLTCKITAICLDLNAVFSNGFDIGLYYIGGDDLETNEPMTSINPTTMIYVNVPWVRISNALRSTILPMLDKIISGLYLTEVSHSPFHTG